MGWIADKTATCPVTLREEGPHIRLPPTLVAVTFWRMVITSGTRGLGLVSRIGAVFASAGVGPAIYFVIAYMSGRGAGQQGWTSTMVVLLVSSRAILFALGVIAEYVGVNVNMAMGKPAYLIVSDPALGPLGKTVHTTPATLPSGTVADAG